MLLRAFHRIHQVPDQFLGLGLGRDLVGDGRAVRLVESDKLGAATSQQPVTELLPLGGFHAIDFTRHSIAFRSNNDVDAGDGVVGTSLPGLIKRRR